MVRFPNASLSKAHQLFFSRHFFFLQRGIYSLLLGGGRGRKKKATAKKPKLGGHLMARLQSRKEEAEKVKALSRYA